MRGLAFKLFQIYARFTRAKTLGARVLTVDARGHVLLVKPTYVDGWILPGGGVDRGETLRDAAIRELREEAGVEALGDLSFHGMFSNEDVFPGDHVACYVCREFKQHAFVPNSEIADARFFALNDLPAHLKPGSLARIDEVLRGAEVSEFWIPR